MTINEFVVILACAVAGFWLVSFVVEAFGSKRNIEDQPSGNSSGKGLRSDEKAVTEPTWFEVLEVAPTASVNEIKAAYRERVRQYHPDRVQGLGFELRQIADQKVKQLNAAYDSALRGRYLGASCVS
jgi:DnaJ-class molecular chaperone